MEDMWEKQIMHTQYVLPSDRMVGALEGSHLEFLPLLCRGKVGMYKVCTCIGEHGAESSLL